MLWGLEDAGAIFAINRVTGRAAVVHPADPARRGFEGLAIDGGVCAAPNNVLEVPGAGPPALAALAAALAALGALRLRRCLPRSA